MNRYYFQENNSGGYTKCLGVLYEPSPHWVYVDAPDVDSAIQLFEDHFNIDWEYENCFEGGSCSCCGRRFEVYSPIEEDTIYNYTYVATYKDAPYFAKASTFIYSTHDKGMALSEAPLRN